MKRSSKGAFNAFLAAWGGAILIALLALLLAGCNVDGDGGADVSSGGGSSEEDTTSTDVNDSTDNTPAEDYTYNEETNTYTVYTADGLLAWNKAAQDDLELNCTLALDIDMTGIDWDSIEWMPVGNDSNKYTGTFDGGGHTITGLTVSQTNYVGLIGSLGSGGVAQNLTLENVNITGNRYVGGVVGHNSGGIVTDCYSTGNVSSNSNNVGGVVGSNSGIVAACYSACSVSGNSGYVGGVVGYNNGTVSNSGTVIACYSTGNVSGNGTSVGGVVGRNNYGTVTACYHATGSVSGTTYFGGVVGFNAKTSTVTACYYSGDSDDGIGTGEGTNTTAGEATKVDSDWSAAVTSMNTAISTWNSENTDKQCDWKYELTGDLPTLVKSE